MSRASSAPSRISGVEREPLAQLGAEHVAVARVADGAGRDRAHAVDAVALVDLDVAGDGLRTTSSIASAESWPEVSTPRPSRVTVERRSISRTRPSTTSATSSRVEFVPMSTTATRKAPHPRGRSVGLARVGGGGERGGAAARHPPDQPRGEDPGRGGEPVGAGDVALGLAARSSLDDRLGDPLGL